MIYIERPLEALAKEGRPLTARDGVAKLFEKRKERYESWADLKVYIERKERMALVRL